VTTNVNGAGIRVAQPEADFDLGTNWEVNPGAVGQPTSLFTYFETNGTSTNFPNSLSSESGHANSVAENFYGIPGGVATNVAHVDNYDAQYFFDSVIDRYSDVVLFFGLLVFYARGNRLFYVFLAAFVMVTSLMVSYTRARAEALIGKCKVGFMERPERIVLIILGALFNRWGVMAPVLWVLAVLSTITVIHRIRYTYLMTRDMEPIRESQAPAYQTVKDDSGPQVRPELPQAASAPRG